MNHDEAIEQLKNQSAHSRLVAARYLERHAEAGDGARLTEALSAELDSWVRRALIGAMGRLGSRVEPGDRVDESAVDIDEVTRDVRAQAVEEVTGRLVHELRTLLGDVDLFAGDEIESYAGSRTNKAIARVNEALDGIETLSHAAQSPQLEEFDLAGRIQGELQTWYSHGVESTGPTPFIVLADFALIGAALRNAIRNALESVNSAGVSLDTEPVIVTWDTTEADYWFAVLDRGVGVPGDSEAAFEIGATDKEGHLGIGLSIARQAAESLGGRVSLEPRERGGARFEFRWQKGRGDNAPSTD